MMSRRPNLLSIAGCDPSGGAGIAADLKTFAAFDVYGMAVITALTAQNTRGVYAIHQSPLPFFDQQISAVLDDVRVDGLKLGMMGSVEIVKSVAAHIRSRSLPHCVLDPVLVATSGDGLSEQGVGAALVSELMPLCEVITPNGPEIASLTGLAQPQTEDEQVEAGRALCARGARAVLVKGGHSQGDEAVDMLVWEGGVRRFAAPRLRTQNTHGTGCTLSSALAAGLAKGWPLAEAVERAKAYVHGAISHGHEVVVGQGHGPLYHGWMRSADHDLLMP